MAQLRQAAKNSKAKNPMEPFTQTKKGGLVKKLCP
jgi:hypothetical protein